MTLRERRNTLDKQSAAQMQLQRADEEIKILKEKLEKESKISAEYEEKYTKLVEAQDTPQTQDLKTELAVVSGENSSKRPPQLRRVNTQILNVKPELQQLEQQKRLQQLEQQKKLQQLEQQNKILTMELETKERKYIAAKKKKKGIPAQISKVGWCNKRK